MRKKKKTKRGCKIFVFVCCFLAGICLLSSQNMGAMEDEGLNAINLTPISQSRSVSAVAVNSNQSMAPHITRIETRLRECLNGLNAGTSTVSRPGSALKDRSDSEAAKLRQRLSNEMDVRLRSDAGTPRQVRVKKQARLNGTVLESAIIKDHLSETERDKKTARKFLRSYRGLLRIFNPDNELRVSRYTKDHLNHRHVRYNQIFRGLPVWPAELNVHLDQNGNVNLMNGSFVPTPRRIITLPVWEADEAINAARSVVPGAENAAANDPDLIIYAPGDKEPRLAWKLELSVSFESNWLVIVDALNGSTLTAYNQVLKDHVSGSGTDLFGETRRLNLWQANDTYFMIDTTKDMYDKTSNPPALDDTRGAIIMKDMNNTDLPPYGGRFNAATVASQSPSAGWLTDAVSLAYCTSETYDYFFDRHNRNSIDGMGTSLMAFVRVGENYDNAFWTSEYNAAFFGDAKPYAGALDVVAHELTHGVTSFTCNLIYQDQPGALNEAFSDIFGEMVEFRTTGNTDWMNGTMLNEDGRSLKDPASVEIWGGYYYPDKMSEFYGRNHPLLQQFVDQDYGGVHINMTILTHCFYMLAEGLDSSIGIRDAEKIFYRAQTIHLVRNSQFIDARLACISSAEELFGDSAFQVESVKEAFDAVEIFDNAPTPEPPPTQPVGGDDASVFIYYDPYYATYFLSRYEEDFGDPITGRTLSCYDVAASRPSVSGDGSLLFFKDSINDACFLETNGSACEACLGMPGTVSSVAMSPDGELYGFVLLDETGEPSNSITVIDLRPGGQTRTFPLVSPATDGESIETVMFADVMDFTSDNRYLVYDAYNVLEFEDGAKLGSWSIYAIDLLTEQTVSLVGPYSEFDIGFPALSQTNNHLMTFDMVDYTTGDTTIVAYDLENGDYEFVGVHAGSWSVPGYNGDDSAIIYSTPDSSVWTGASLMRQAVSQNGITPIGSPTFYLGDADYGVVYRRGTFMSPEPEIDVSPDALSFGTVSIGNKQTRTITISNTGTGNLLIEDVELSGSDSAQYNIVGGCVGQSLPSSGTCQFNVGFSPTSVGEKNVILTIHSNASDTPELIIQVFGTGAPPPDQPPTGLTANAVSSRKIMLRWTDRSADEDGFEIERKERGCNSSYQWYPIAMVSENINRFDDTEFEPDTQYSYRVRAYNASDHSEYSNCGTTVSGISGTPSAPVHLMATWVSSSRVDLTWDEWSSIVTEFRIYREVNDSDSWALVATTGPDTLSYNDESASGNQTKTGYCYYVQACNSYGCSPPTYTVCVPFNPTGLSATAESKGKIVLNWNDNSDNERGFEIYRKTGDCSSSGSWEKVKQAGIDRTIVSDRKDLIPGTTYSYKVRAYCRSWGLPYVYGYSAWSDCISVVYSQSTGTDASGN